MKVTAIILTYNEERHLARCVASVRPCVDEVLVVDSFSTDATVALARELGARVVQHSWINHAAQFNWALTQLDAATDWVLRVDADEVVTPVLAAEIRARLPQLGPEIDGVHLRRLMTFQGRLIRHGGLFPVKVLRLFRRGRGRCEQRWMDEHVVVSGATLEFAGELIDDNLNTLTWWTDKHNHYASREAVVLLNLEYGFLPADPESARPHGQAGGKRWLKERLYARLPRGLRALGYFLYRYVLRLGFLDGQAGASFHLLQGFWYRYLVDTKLAEVKRYMREHAVDAETAIERTLNIKCKAA